MDKVNMTINASRLKKYIHDLAQVGKLGETGVCRLALSEEYREGIDLVKKWMDEAGLQTRVDNFGNLIGRLEGKNPSAPVLMIGSHIDSQPNGGRYDGPIGVLGGLEVLQTMKENDITPENPIEVIAFCDEEGYRFKVGLFGSRGILGKLEDGELEREDENGITRREALISFGANPDKLEDSEYEKDSIKHYLEMHIEQGPVLEDKDEPVGIVEGIAGPLWLTVEITGYAGHAGTVPMALRKDALVGAAKMITSLNTIVKQNEDAPTVGTIGSIDVHPDARAVIPDKVSFTVDLRDIDKKRRDQCENDFRKAVHEICQEHQLTYTIKVDSNIAPNFCDEDIKEKMRESSKDMGLKDVPELASGAFHDALTMADACPFGMIFVQSKDGVSHNPDEFSTNEDIAVGTELLYRTALKLTSK